MTSHPTKILGGCAPGIPGGVDASAFARPGWIREEKRKGKWEKKRRGKGKGDWKRKGQEQEVNGNRRGK